MELNVEIGSKLNVPSNDMKLEKSKSVVNTNVLKEILFKVIRDVLVEVDVWYYIGFQNQIWS